MSKIEQDTLTSLNAMRDEALTALHVLRPQDASKFGLAVHRLHHAATFGGFDPFDKYDDDLRREIMSNPLARRLYEMGAIDEQSRASGDRAEEGTPTDAVTQLVEELKACNELHEVWAVIRKHDRRSTPRGHSPDVRPRVPRSAIVKHPVVFGKKGQGQTSNCVVYLDDDGEIWMDNGAGAIPLVVLRADAIVVIPSESVQEGE